MIFLSYSHKEKALLMPMAEAFHKTFAEDKIFFDESSIQPGGSLIDRMGYPIPKVDQNRSLCRNNPRLKHFHLLHLHELARDE